MTTKTDDIEDFDLPEEKIEEPKKKAPARKKPAAKNPMLQKRIECTVRATQPSASKVFKLNVPHPTNGNPILIEGRCGIRIKEGLTEYAISCLERAYTNVMVEVPEAERTGDVGLTHRRQRVPMYNVEKHGEVKDPKPIGKGGK